MVFFTLLPFHSVNFLTTSCVRRKLFCGIPQTSKFKEVLLNTFIHEPNNVNQENHD